MRGLRSITAGIALVSAWIEGAAAAPAEPVPPAPPPVRVVPIPVRPPPVLVAPPPPPQTSGKSRPAVPATPPGSWIAPEDYPAVAIRAGVDGVTGVVVGVADDGSVAGCRVAQSSGSDVLDATACALIRERAAFRPALDRNGRPTAGTYSTRVAWRIPENTNQDVRPLREGTLSFSFVAETDGTVSDCRIVEATEVVSLADVCPPAGEHVPPILDENGEPVRKRVTVTLKTELADPQ